MENKIQARELRIGNFILLHNKLVIIEDISSEGINYTIDYADNPEWQSFDYCLGIPLTETELVKLGAYYSQEIQQGMSMVIDLNQRIKLVFANRDVKCLSIYQDGAMIDLRSNSHSNLHQIQNLAFDLTGQELTYK